MVTIGEKKTTSERLFSMLETDYLAKNKTRADFMKDLEAALVKANPAINVNEINAHVTKWLIDRENTYIMPVVNLNQFAPTMSTFKETKIKKSLMLEQLLASISPDTKIVMFPMDGHLFMKGERGQFGDLTDVANITTLQNLIYTAAGQGNYWRANNSSPNAYSSGTQKALTMIENDMFVYRYGSSEHVFGIDARQSNLNYITSLWVRDLARRTKLNKNDADYLSEADFQAKIRNEGREYGQVRILRKDSKTGIEQEIAVNPKDIKNTDQIILSPQNASKTWNPSNLEQRMKNILDDMIFGKLLPDVYWSQKLWKAEGAAFLNMMKRTPLTHNISANRFSAETMREIAAGWTKKALVILDCLEIKEEIEEQKLEFY